MRCLIYAKSTEMLWLRMFFPDVDPYLLKVVNKPLLEYYLDLASLLKVSELRIVSDASIKGIERYFKDGAKWGVNISYMLAKPDDTLQNVYLKNYSFCQDHDMLFMDGYFFVEYDKHEFVNSVDAAKKFCCSSEKRRLIYLPKGVALKDLSNEDELISCVKVREIRTVVDYYNLSMDILKEGGQSYVLPGYSTDKDTHLGINLVYPNSSKLVPPLMIGNNSRFQKYTVIGANAIIGDHVIIDENTTVNDSIVYDNTYIGPELDIEKKIVVKNNLINGLTGESIYIRDKILVSQVDQGIVVSYFNRMVQRLMAIVLVILQFVPWLLMYLPYIVFSRDYKSDFVLDKALMLKLLDDPKKYQKSLWGRMLLRLSLDKFPLLFKVIFGKFGLVGNRLYVNNARNRSLIMDLPIYNPGVFSLGETVVAENQDVELFYELEYIDNVSTRFNVKIVLRCLAHRFKNPTA